MKKCLLKRFGGQFSNWLKVEGKGSVRISIDYIKYNKSLNSYIDD